MLLLTRFRCSFFLTWSKSFFVSAFDACIPLSSAYSAYSGYSDFSCLLRVMISETRILCHFILVLLSSTLMKQLTWCVLYYFSYKFFGLDI